MTAFFLFLAVASYFPAQNPPRATQTSTGNCSPNIVVTGTGSVVVQISGCNGADPALLRMVTRQAQSLQELLKQYPLLVSKLNAIMSTNKQLAAKLREFEAAVKNFDDLTHVLDGLGADAKFRRDAAAALTAGNIDAAAQLLEETDDPVIKAKIAAARAARRELEQVYPKVEQLIAIYSLVNWRSRDQQPPLIVRGGDNAEKAFELACNTLKWGSPTMSIGELFDCFAEKVRVFIPVADETIETRRVVSNEDFWYDFSWNTLFGYPLRATVSPTPTQYPAVYNLRKELVETEGKRCREELQGSANAESICSFNTYVVRLEDLTYSKSVVFLVSDGYLVWLADGSVSRRNEWVVYVDSTSPITMGSLNKSIQLIARQMQLKETDLSQIAPELEMKWMDHTRAFVSSLFVELDRQPDLIALTRFLKSAIR
jgi:hypothetical protein